MTTRSEEFFIAKASGGVFNAAQIKILRALRNVNPNRHPDGISRADLKEAVGIRREVKYSQSWLNSLHELQNKRLIGIYDYPDHKGYTHKITKEGRKALESAEEA